jgi:hypothetical protein
MASVVQLADEVLVGVLSWLSADGLVLSRQVCQDWLRVADDDLLWRPLVTSVRPPPKCAIILFLCTLPLQN